jgi:uncharacterized membrane protein
VSLRVVQTAALLAATITTGLMAGLFAGFAYSVMPGLGRSSSRTLIEAMQNINKAIINGWFMLPFLGSAPLIVLAVVLAWRGYGRNALPWIIAALAVYLVAFVITSAVNVPLNNQLDKAGNPAHISDLAAIRNSFEHKWVTWNIVRALVHAAAFGCLAWALVLYGAHRGQAHPAGRPSLGAPAATHVPAPVRPAGTPPTHLQPRAAEPPHG